MSSSVKHQRAMDYLSRCPLAGAGVHRWIYGAACSLREAGFTPVEAHGMIAGSSQSCGRDVSDREIFDAINSAWACGVSTNSLPRNKSARSTGKPKWPVRNYSAIHKIAVAGSNLDGLRQISPEKVADEVRVTDTVLGALYRGNSLMCCGHTIRHFQTKSLQDWGQDLHDLQFIVPSPMKATTGLTKLGRSSARSLDNIGPREFLVIECDFCWGDQNGKDSADRPLLESLREKGLSIADLCASILLKLAENAPLALVVSSGGKSLHGWFPCKGFSDAQLLPFMKFAVSLGADPATWVPCQMVRMPDGTRDNGARQQVLYFNREVLA
ncbi:hypothetical protein DES53_12038 [Roseimicrobium gellanilyticum]|uniref:Uncharacterized protein n=1 Tax=Roseimicrobium gellanilyticum TaxID=748857 RepID=A0A366H305_9BACT|nr:hypothetical protein [Roseimicrobium gellanilyticum]RBP35670.1 hypothetical protein DES53_12038 [Roseimicrobium gellanilyticum]